MKKIVILGDVPHRILDQIELMEQINHIERYEFYFLIPFGNRDKFLHRSDNSLFTMVEIKSVDTRKMVKKEDNKENLEFVNNKSAYHFIKSCSCFQIIQGLRQLVRLFRFYFVIKVKLDSIKPLLVILNGDRNYGFEQAVLRYAKKRSLPVIIPYLVISDKTGPEKLRLNNPMYHVSDNANVLTDWIKKNKSGQISDNLLFYPTPSTVALYLFGTLSPNPWQIGSNWCDVVCVDSKMTCDRYAMNGIPPGKLRIIGDISYDKLFYSCENRNVIKEAVTNKYHLDVSKQTCLVSLPQWLEHDIISKEKHWENIEFIVSLCAEIGQNLLLSLHPRMELKSYKYLESKYPCSIVDERLFALLPSADIFIAEMASSTIIWGILCGVKTVAMNYMVKGYSVYNDLTSMERVDRKEDFKLQLQALFNGSKDFASDWELLSRRDVFDGKTGERYNNLFNEVVLNSKKS